MSLNVVALCGRMVRDPEVKQVNGRSCANFTIAVDRNYRSADKEKITDFVDCTAWQQTADFVGRYCTKGREVTVHGSLESRKWTDKSGNNRTSWYVKCENVNGVGSRTEETPARSPSEYPAAPTAASQEYHSYWQQGTMTPQVPPEEYAILTDDDSGLPF